jgi:hypothetical protein
VRVAAQRQQTEGKLISQRPANSKSRGICKVCETSLSNNEASVLRPRSGNCRGLLIRTSLLWLRSSCSAQLSECCGCVLYPVPCRSFPNPVSTFTSPVALDDVTPKQRLQTSRAHGQHSCCANSYATANHCSRRRLLVSSSPLRSTRSRCRHHHHTTTTVLPSHRFGRIHASTLKSIISLWLQHFNPLRALSCSRVPCLRCWFRVKQASPRRPHPASRSKLWL